MLRLPYNTVYLIAAFYCDCFFFTLILYLHIHLGSAKRWKKFVDSETPEKEKFPGEWKNKTSLQRLCMMRALRPDRMTYTVM